MDDILSKISPLWNTRNFAEGEPVMIRRLGSNTPGEYKAIIRGVYACDIHGAPDAYIVEMIDKLPDQKYSCLVMSRGCVDQIEPIFLEPVK